MKSAKLPTRGVSRLRHLIALPGLIATPFAAFAAGNEVPISSEAFVAMLRWMENEQRQIEWWFQLLASFVGVAIVLLLIGAVAVPMFMMREQRRRLDKHIQEAKLLVSQLQEDAQPRVRPARTPRYQSTLETAPPVFGLLEDKRREPIDAAVSEALADPEATPKVRLRAGALQSETHRQWSEASALWHALNHLDERDGQALYGEAHARQQMIRRFHAPYLQHELKAISALCQQVIEQDPAHQPAHGLRGMALAELARCSGDRGTASALYLRADSCFREALRLSPRDTRLHCARADALRDYARNGGEEANRDYAQAAEAYIAALDLRPELAEALDGLIATQTERAWMNHVTRKPVDGLFDVLDMRLKSALTVTGRSPESLRRQVLSLAMRLRFVPPQKARGYFQIARNKVREISTSHPEDRDTLRAWGLAQLHLGCHANQGGALRERLFNQADKAFKRCEQLLAGSAAFELARLAALRGAPGRCRQWVERARDCNSLPACSLLHAAPDLALVRHSAWYNQLLAGRGCLELTGSPAPSGKTRAPQPAPTSAARDSAVPTGASKPRAGVRPASGRGGRANVSPPTEPAK